MKNQLATANTNLDTITLQVKSNESLNLIKDYHTKLVSIKVSINEYEELINQLKPTESVFLSNNFTNLNESFPVLAENNKLYLESYITGKYKKKIKEKVEFMRVTAENINRWCQTKKSENESSKQTMQLLTSQLNNIDNNVSDEEDDKVFTPGKNDAMKQFRNTFKNLVKKDNNDKHTDDFTSKIQALKNLIIKKKAEALQMEKDSMEADKYSYGIDCERDIQKAIECYEKLSSKGNARAKYCLAKMMIEGNIIDKNIDRAYIMLRELTEDTAPRNKYYRGKAYCLEASIWETGCAPPAFGGEYRPQYSQACMLLERAAEECNSSEAYNNLGIMYKSGMYTDVDGITSPVEYVKAFKLFEESRKIDNNSLALNNLGTCYFQGLGVNKNLEQAFIHFKQAVDKGSVLALSNLAVCYYNGHGCMQDRERSLTLLERGIKLKCPSAMAKFGRMTMQKSPQRALEMLKLSFSIDPQNYEAIHDIGNMYFYGLGVSKDIDMALFWYMKSSNLDYQPSCLKVGDIYYGKSLQGLKNINDAMLYYQKASEEPEALNNLGIISEDHFNDLVAAMDYYYAAMDKLHCEAPYNLSSLINKNFESEEVVNYVKSKGYTPNEDYVLALMIAALQLGSLSAKIELAKLEYKPSAEQRNNCDNWYDDPAQFLKELAEHPLSRPNETNTQINKQNNESKLDFDLLNIKSEFDNKINELKSSIYVDSFPKV